MYKNSLQKVLSCLKYQILIFQFTQEWTIYSNYKKERNSWNNCYLLSKEWNHEFTANLLQFFFFLVKAPQSIHHHGRLGVILKTSVIPDSLFIDNK